MKQGTAKLAEDYCFIHKALQPVGKARRQIAAVPPSNLRPVTCCIRWLVNYSRFGAICELESVQAVAPQKPRCSATFCIKRKSICIHFDVRKGALNVLLYTFYSILFYFRIHCQWLKNKSWFSGKKRIVVPDPSLPLYAFINVDNCERPLISRTFQMKATLTKTATRNFVMKHYI